MNKREFLEKLRQALTGRVASSVVTENINYYEDYINVEVRKGRSEEEVLNQLGDPRLIARTIVETSGGSWSAEGGRGGSDSYNKHSDSYNKHSDSDNAGSLGRRIRIPGWMMLILLLVIVAVVLSFVFSVVTAILPVLLPILVVVFLVKLFRDWLN